MRILLAVGIVAALGARAAADCAAAEDALERLDLTLASALARGCDPDAATPGLIAKAAQAKGWSRITIVTKPEGVAVALDRRTDVALVGGDEVWLPPGTYTFSAGGMGSTVWVKDGANAVVLLEVPAGTTEVHDGSIDFGDEGGGTVVNGPPPKIKHPSLLPDRFQKGVDVKGGGGALVEEHAELADPDRARLGVEVGAAASSGGGAMGWSVAAVARASWVQGEAAWIRRGLGDEVALPVLVHHGFATTDALAFGAGAGAQAELRLGDAATMHGRWGASAVASVDGELRDYGVVVDVRGEYGAVWAIGVRIGMLF